MSASVSEAGHALAILWRARHRCVEGFVTVGAVFGGMGLIANNSIGMPPEWLEANRSRPGCDRACRSCWSSRCRWAWRPCRDRPPEEGIRCTGPCRRGRADAWAAVRAWLSKAAAGSVTPIVLDRQEVRPMNAVVTVGAPLPSTIVRLG